MPCDCQLKIFLGLRHTDDITGHIPLLPPKLAELTNTMIFSLKFLQHFSKPD